MGVGGFHDHETSRVPILEAGLLLRGERSCFRLHRELAAKNSSAVWSAVDVNTSEFVALKVLNSAHTLTPAALDAFVFQLEQHAQLRHSNLVRTRGVYLDDTRTGAPPIVFVVMDLLCGQSLYRMANDQRDRGAVGLGAAVVHKVLLGVSAALKYAWDEHRVVHRDIKPSNVFVSTTGEVTLIDLGDAGPVATGARALSSLSERGSQDYVAQWFDSSRDDTPSRDAYALALTGIDLLVGATDWRPICNARRLLDSVDSRAAPLLRSLVAAVEPVLGVNGVKYKFANAWDLAASTGVPSRDHRATNARTGSSAESLRINEFVAAIEWRRLAVHPDLLRLKTTRAHGSGGMVWCEVMRDPMTIEKFRALRAMLRLGRAYDEPFRNPNVPATSVEPPMVVRLIEALNNEQPEQFEYGLPGRMLWWHFCSAGSSRPLGVGDRHDMEVSPQTVVYKYDEPRDDGTKFLTSSLLAGPVAVDDDRNHVNAFDLRGMYGNVKEMVTDDGGREIYAAGGGFRSPPKDLRSNHFVAVEHGRAAVDLGFRLIRILKKH